MHFGELLLWALGARIHFFGCWGEGLVTLAFEGEDSLIFWVDGFSDFDLFLVVLLDEDVL